MREEDMLIKSKIPDSTDPSEWEIVEETQDYEIRFIKGIYKALIRFIRRAIFERGWPAVPPEEESGYIVPKIWSECEAIKQWGKRGGK